MHANSFLEFVFAFFPPRLFVCVVVAIYNNLSVVVCALDVVVSLVFLSRFVSFRFFLLFLNIF